jgi:hypothetical protein
MPPKVSPGTNGDAKHQTTPMNKIKMLVNQPIPTNLFPDKKCAEPETKSDNNTPIQGRNGLTGSF